MAADQPSPTRPQRSWLQFSIRTLLVSAVFVALGCAALLNASEWWARVVIEATLAMLLVAVLLSIFRRGPGRAFWIGFAVVGWVYFWLTAGQWQFLRWFGWSKLPLLTTKLAELAYCELHVTDGLLISTNGGEQENFIMVAHCLWTWLFAMLGGLLARYLYATREKEP